MTIDEPHNTWAWMTSDATAEACPFSLFDGDGVGRQHERRLHLLLLRLDLLLRNAVQVGFDLTDLLQALHALWQLRVVDDARFAGSLDEGASFVHSVQVGGAAEIFTGIFGVDPTEVHRDVTKVVNWHETVF